MRRLLLTLAVALTLAGCGGSDASDVSITTTTAPPFPAADATDTMTLGLVNYAFTGVKSQVAGPNLLIKAANDTTTAHEVAIFDESGEEIGEIEEFVKGSRTIAIALAPGTYQLKCLVKEGARTHAELGMEANVVVSADG